MKYIQTIAKSKFVIAALLLSTVLGFSVIYGLSARPNTVANVVIEEKICDGTCIELTSDGASPSSVAVPVGSFVQFNSADGKSHSLSLGEGGHEHSHTGKFSSGTFEADEAWRVQFNDNGTFQFHDHFNPDTNVVVVVYTPGKEYKIE